MHPPALAERRGATTAVAVALLVGVLLRLTVLTWSDPWEPHHPDEHTLPVEALALWEGITPYEVGWPAATTRLILSGVSAVQWAVAEGWEAWDSRGNPGEVLNGLTYWIGERYSDPAPLYKLGRAVSVTTGILQLLATIWALAQWARPWGRAAALLGAALAPTAVTYSQYVLADITGLLFATVCIGLAAQPTPRRIAGMSALAALAACSKFHFGVWLLAPLVCVWVSVNSTILRRIGMTALVFGIAGWVFITLVPWAVINPIFAAKEFAHVVLSKVGSGAAPSGAWLNASVVIGSLGMLVWAGAAIGLVSIGRGDLRRLMPAIVPTLSALAALSFSATVFDRHGLVLLPGMLVLGAIGWSHAWDIHERVPRSLAAIAFGVCVLFTSLTLRGAVQTAAEADVDVLVKHWVLTHVPPGSRVAVQDEMNAFLPRVPEQLRQCADQPETADAFKARWGLLGLSGPTDAEPFRAAVLNDQVFQAYRCQRELQAIESDGTGYWLVFYHQQPRFLSLLEQEAIREFFARSSTRSGGIDVLVVNRELEDAESPTMLFKTRRGHRAIYVRP